MHSHIKDLRTGPKPAADLALTIFLPFANDYSMLKLRMKIIGRINCHYFGAFKNVKRIVPTNIRQERSVESERKH